MTTTAHPKTPPAAAPSPRPVARPGTLPTGGELLRFPPDFVWGAATAAYQIEGAAAEDGRTPSIWDTFSHAPGNVVGGDTGDVGCDHYHRLEDDLDLMVELGLPAYRFSVSWPRVQPGGRGAVNPAGLDFYRRLVDGLLDRGIAPLLTLYHWDLPQELEDVGGWLNRDVASRFVEYAEIVGAAVGDRVAGISTLNEPWCSAFLGYSVGVHAPGRSDNRLALRAAHHLNLAHGSAIEALRRIVPGTTPLSIVCNVMQNYPATDSAADVAATRHVDHLSNGIFLDPILRGAYPAELIEQTAHLTDWSFVADGDLAQINQPIDVLGVNFYHPNRIAAVSDSVHPADGRAANHHAGVDNPQYWPGSDWAVNVGIGGPSTDMGWPILPAGLTDLLLMLDKEYSALPLMITENGAAYDDGVSPDGGVHDADRIAYLRSHLAAVHDAIEQGVDVRAYYQWSLMDNFEWAWGYSKRFGMVHVDYNTLVRTPKDSAIWYRQVIGDHGVPAG